MSKRISLMMSDEQYDILLEEVKKSGLSLSQFIIGKIVPANSRFEELWTDLVNKLKTFPSGVEFTLPSVVGVDVWDSYSRSEKLSLSRLFYRKIPSEEFPDIQRVGRSSSNVSVYVKRSVKE